MNRVILPDGNTILIVEDDAELERNLKEFNREFKKMVKDET